MSEVTVPGTLLFLQALILSAYLATAAIWDLRTCIVPNWLTLPAMALVAVWQLAHGHAEFLAFWLALYLAWGLRLLCGGDAKLLMVLFGLWPSQEFFLVFAGVILTIAAPVLAWRYLPRSRWTGRRIWNRLVTGTWLPTTEEQEHWTPGAWKFALGGILYAWLLVAEAVAPLAR